MSKITFAEDAWTEYLYWQSQDKKTLKKINNLLKSIQREPFTGEGKPEPLKNSPDEEWSRRISKTHYPLQSNAERNAYSRTNEYM